MSFAKIAEARAVKKIVAYICLQRQEFPPDSYTGAMLSRLALRIEEGVWKDIKLPKPEPKKKKKR